MKLSWLDRAWIAGPYLTLCTTEKEWLAVLNFLNVNYADRNKWVSQGAHATTHYLHCENKTVVVVCISSTQGETGCEIAALLAHEAVHVFQEWCRSHGEDNPSAEFEAYSIQAICFELFNEYAKRIKRRGAK